MKVCIVGAGAIGGFIGARIAAARVADVSAYARGATLAALRIHGWRLQMGDAMLQSPTMASDRALDLGVQDLVVIAVKAPALTAVARDIGPLLGPGTLVLPAMNGVPWWFLRGIDSIGNAPLNIADPGAEIAKAIAWEQVIGCVIHASTSTSEPGLVHHRMGHGIVVGEPSGASSERVQRIAELLQRSGFLVTQSTNIRNDIWYKLWGNMTMNPVSAMTGATSDKMLADPLVTAFCAAAMNEAAAIGARIGCTISESPQDRNAMAAKLGSFKTSMLQDAEAGRSIELDAIVGVVRELGQRLSVPTPNIDALLGLTRLFGRVHGLYPWP